MNEKSLQNQNSGIVKSQKLEKGTKLTLKKSLSLAKSTKTSYILADISGSMMGEKLSELKKALHKVWRPGIHGIAFGSDIYDFDEKDINSLYVSGSTNMLGALQAAWDDRVDHIVLLTDGMPDQPETVILSYVRQNQSIPIDTIAIGSNCNTNLLIQISNLTNGRFNSLNEPLMLSDVMTELLKIEEKAGPSGNQAILL
jgi:succinyl-CoA synthetase alpha subunit